MVFFDVLTDGCARYARCGARGDSPLTPALTPSRSLNLRRRENLHTILNTPLTHQGGLADRRRPTRANHRQTTLGRRPRPSQNRPLCLTIVGIHLWRIWQSGNDLARTWQRLGMSEREGGNLTNVLQALEGVLEAFWGRLGGS